MAELLRDQPDYYTTTTFPVMVEDIHADAIVVVGAGWDGKNAWSATTEGAFALWFHQRAGQSNGFSIGHHLRIDAYPSAEQILAGVTDGDGDLHCCCTVDSTGLLRIRNGDLAGTLLAGPSTEPIPIGVDLSFGITGVIGVSNGTFEVWWGYRDFLDDDLDGFMVRLSAGPADTQAADTSFWLGYYMGLNPDIFQSHLYLRDDRSTEGGMIDLVPGYYVKVLRPIGDGVYTGWTPSAGSARYAMIDDADEDGDTTNIYGSALDLENSYSEVFEDMIDAEVIYGVDLVTIAKGTFEGIAAGAQFSSTVVHDADTAPLPFERPPVGLLEDVYRCVRELFPLNLKTGLPWEDAELQDGVTEFGGTLVEP